MNYYEPEWNRSKVVDFIARGAGALIGLVVAVLYALNPMGFGSGTVSLAVVVGVLAFFMGGLSMLTFGRDMYRVPYDKYQADFDALYGRTDLAMERLPFPVRKPELGQRALFGSTTFKKFDGDKVERLEVELAWDGQQFQLFENGNRLRPVPPRREVTAAK